MSSSNPPVEASTEEMFNFRKFAIQQKFSYRANINLMLRKENIENCSNLITSHVDFDNCVGL